MAVYPKNGKVWIDISLPNRKRLRFSTGEPYSKERARYYESCEASIRKQFLAGKFSKDEFLGRAIPGTFRDEANAWLMSKQPPVVRKSTYRFYKDGLRHAERYFGNELVGNITSRRLRNFQIHLEKKGLGTWRINGIMTPVKAILREAFREGKIKVLPEVRAVANRTLRKIDPFAPREIELLLSNITPFYRRYYAFLFLSGVRPEEATGLKWEDINFETDKIEVRCGRYRGEEGLPKQRRARVIHLTPAMKQLLLEQRKLVAGASEYVFINQDGRPINHNAMPKHWSAAFRKAGLRYRHPYQIRHTFATLSLQSDPIEYICNQMGTSEEMFWRHYKRWIASARLRGGAMDRILGRCVTKCVTKAKGKDAKLLIMRA